MVEWTEIKEHPKGLRYGIQAVRIASVRQYKNQKGNQCIELMLENDAGGRCPIWLSIEPEHRSIMESFLQRYMRIGYADVVRRGGWESLVGIEFMVEVDFPDGKTPSLQPVWW